MAGQGAACQNGGNSFWPQWTDPTEMPVPPFVPVLARFVHASPAMKAPLLMAAIILLAISAQLSLPVEPVPITLQSYTVITLAALMGWQLGGFSMLVYIGLGLSGLHIFSNGRGGLEVLSGMSAGFIIGFLVVTVLVGWLQENWGRGRIWPLLVLLALGHVVLMAIGAGWMAVLRGPAFAWEKGFVPFVPGAVLKTLVAWGTVLLVERLARPAGRA